LKTKKIRVAEYRTPSEKWRRITTETRSYNST
jgi:hypothetical protein